MPSRNPFYDLPLFQKTGDEGVDKALEKWRQDFGAAYARNLYESERLPFVASTFSPDTFTLTTVSWATTVLSYTLGFQGNEQVVVTGNMTGNVSGLASEISFVTFALFMTRPDGVTEDLSSRFGFFGFSSGMGSHGMSGAVSQSWRIEPRIQIGGQHTLALRAHRGGSTANTFEDPGLIIQVV